MKKKVYIILILLASILQVGCIHEDNQSNVCDTTVVVHIHRYAPMYADLYSDSVCVDSTQVVMCQIYDILGLLYQNYLNAKREERRGNTESINELHQIYLIINRLYQDYLRENDDGTIQPLGEEAHIVARHNVSEKKLESRISELENQLADAKVNKGKINISRSICGEWVSGTLHEVYKSDNTGQQWDTKDDVSREESQMFEWKIEDNSLRQIYRMQLGGVVPREYTVTFINEESLVYKDDFGTVFMWDKNN